jgi:hypothetical protein
VSVTVAITTWWRDLRADIRADCMPLLLRLGWETETPRPAVSASVLEPAATKNDTMSNLKPDPVIPVPAESADVNPVKPPRRDQLIMDADGRLVHWPEQPEPPRRTARCAYRATVPVHCEDGTLLDSIGASRGICPCCFGEGSVNLQ